MSDEKQVHIGKRIRNSREEAGLSQGQLGEKVGYSAMGISHIEKGNRKIKLEDLQKIAHVLHLDMSYLLEPITRAASSSSVPSYPTTFYRRGQDSLNEEQKKAEHDAMTKLDDLISKM